MSVAKDMVLAMTAPRADTGTCENCQRPERARFPDPNTDMRICLDCCAESATRIENIVDRFICPRRIEIPSTFKLSAADTWQDRTGKLYCAHCGSLHPLAFMRAVTNDVVLGPTDKSYKVYVGPSGGDKFYFQHLSVDDRMTFIRLLNAKVPNIGHPGHFYTRSFFIGY